MEIEWGIDLLVIIIFDFEESSYSFSFDIIEIIYSDLVGGLNLNNDKGEESLFGS